MITENVSRVWRIYCDYGRGKIEWDAAMERLVDLGVDRSIAPRVLLGKYMIAGH